MGVILVLSLFPFRKKAYEFFLFCHIICAILFLVFLYHHLKLSKTNSYDGWIWACVSMWAFDRFARLLRVVILNARAFSSNPANHHLARAKFVKGTDIIQLTVYPSAEDVGYFPGAHFFVFLTGSWRFWECHPFTAADWRPSEPTLTGMPQRSPSGARSLSESLADSLNGSLSKEIGVKSGALRGGAVVKRSGSGRSGRSGSGRSGSGVNRSGSGRSGVTRSGSGRSCRSGRSGVARSGSGRSKSSRSERERSRSERDRSRGGSRERTRLRGGEPSPNDLCGGDLGLRGGGLNIEDAEAILGLRGGDLHRQKSRNIYIVKQNGNQGNIFVVSDTGKGHPIHSDAPGVGDIERTGTPRGGLERSKSESTRKELAKAKIAKAQEVARAKDAAEKAKEAIRIYELTKARELAKAKAELEKFRKAVTPPLKDPESEKSPASPEADSEKELHGEPPLKKGKEPSKAIKEAPPKPESSKRKPKRTHSKTETKEERAAAREKRAEKRRKRLAEKDEESETEPETGTEDIDAGVLEKYVPDLRGINEDDDDVDPEKLALELALGKDGLDDDDEDDEGMSIEKELEMLKQRQREEAEIRRRAIELEEEQGDLSQILLTTRTTGSVNRPPGHGRGPPRPKLTFLIKPRKGMTATLASMIRENDEAQVRRGVTRIKELEIKCLIEGAYGINRPMHLFETAVVIAGGVGVTTILPYLADFNNRSRGAGPENRTLTRRFVFVWTAREEELVENVVVKRIPKGVLNREDVSLQLYVTKKKAEGEKKLPGVRYRRPNIPEILAAERKRLVGRMAVLSCGPSVLVDITRNAVVECLTQERKHVQYFEESYGW
ncbi:hypothetical protein B9Z19DRAFT_1084281 [Tuber borchii]|uniref:Ferric reductase NAD binding domain-containing protein n=1 Tax=Tuber borchii TaxID=42251 RepID=A0A2T6ZSA2_TUBBO|nr:hypothetical protein B9Z19DRAFT_1084281 [Tuber borchii]